MDYASAFLGGMGRGLDLAERFEQTRQIVYEREQQSKAQADYDRFMAEKIRPLRAAREALFADLATTQHEYQEAMEGRSGASLVEIAEIEARYRGKIGAYAQIGATASSQEIALWTEFANSDISNPFKVQQAGLEVKQILGAEAQLAGIVEQAASQYAELGKAQATETGLQIDQQQADAQMLGARASMVSAGASAHNASFRERELALEERRLDIMERGEEGGTPPRPADRARLLQAIDTELALHTQAPNIEGMRGLAAEVATEGIEFDPEEAMKDPSTRARLLEAARYQRIRDRGGDIGDTVMPRRAQERLDAMYEEQEERRSKLKQRQPMREASEAIRNSGGDYSRLSDDELQTALESTRGTVAALRKTPAIKKYAGVDRASIPEKDRATAARDLDRFDKAKRLQERLEAVRKERSQRGLSDKAEASIDDLLGAAE